MKVSNVFIILIAGLLFFQSCNFLPHNNISDTSIAGKTIVPGSFNTNSGIKLDSADIQKFLSEKPLFEEFRRQFDTLYQANNYNYVWYNNNGLIETASELIAGLENIKQEGVTANVPYKDTLDQLLHSATDTANKTRPDINTELMLTGEYFYYAMKIWGGALNKKADSINWYIPRKKLSYAQLLESNLKSGSIASGPDGVVAGYQYEGLKKALAQYKEIDQNANEVVVPLLKDKSVLSPGAFSPVIADVRKRLTQLGYTNSADTGNLYNVTLAGIVAQVKPTYGLPADSIINNAFINAINIPAKKREEQIIVNMERLRWIPVDTVSKEFILVNIPEYTLVYYEQGKPVWRCGVVVGKPMTKTVIFSGDMRYVVFSPYWNVPSSIINKEIRPGMARSKNYLARHNMEWNGGRVRQRPGPSNSLGLVKFLFPNSNNIYLHDTPSKSLFNETNRAFSHGCIRVSKPKDLAIRVLRQYPEWTPEKIDAAMHAGKEKYITLERTIPVFIGYFTAFIDEGGHANFRPDIYQRDKGLLDLLMQN